jgi:pimeloyl-ACP methyl ester carboxylesterase
MPSDAHETTVPQWLVRARATPGERRFVGVAGCPIHYLRWGDTSHPGVMLIAGAGGHAQWFAHVAPLLADQFHVVAIDLGGCGDSGHRDAYTLELVAAEIMAVCADAGMLAADIRPVLVGHSAGGQFALRTALAHGDALLGVIALDALRYARLPGDPAMQMRPDLPRDTRPPRLYPDQASAMARFRLQPEPQVPVTLPGLLDDIAWHSVRDIAGGWTWKFDPRLTAILSAGLDLKDRLGDLSCHLAAIYGEHTHLADGTVLAAMAAITQGKAPVFIIPGSGHYPMLDSPLAFVAAVKGVVTSWVAAARANRD